MFKSSKLLGGILLVSGTTIGAGMLALPVATGMAGFYPSLAILIAFWALMTYTALLYLEVNLWFGERINMISMAHGTLGRWAEIVNWILYLLLLYLLTTAYIAGSRPIISNFVESLTGYHMPHWMAPVPLLGFFGFFVFEGTKYVDYLNRILMTGLVVTFCLIVSFLTPHVDFELVDYRNSYFLLIGISTVATSYGFHIIIPSLTTYMHRDIPRLRLAILIGSVIPLVVYILWTFTSLGVIPLAGEHGIIEGYAKGSDGVSLMTGILGKGVLGMMAHLFSFFAIVTSFLGVSLSLVDFLADGLKVKKTYFGRILLCTLAFTPPLLITLTNPRAFLTALEYAGAFCVMVLLALMPALMVWAGRYRKGFESTYKAPGGKLALIFVMIVSVSVVLIEIAHKLDMLPYIKG